MLPSERSNTRVDRIPVSMVVDGHEVGWDEKKDEKSGTSKERHDKDEDDFWDTLSDLEPMQVHW